MVKIKGIRSIYCLKYEWLTCKFNPPENKFFKKGEDMIVFNILNKRYFYFTLLAMGIFFSLFVNLVYAEESPISQPDRKELIVDVHQQNFSFGNKETNERVAIGMANNMREVMPYLQSLMKEDEARSEEDKKYQLSAPLSSFLYLMSVSAEAGLDNGINEVSASDFTKIFILAKKHGFIIDHPMAGEILNHIKRAEFFREGNAIKIVMYTHSGERESIRFTQQFSSQRVFVKGVALENKASFTISNLLDNRNAKEVERLKKDSQKTIVKLVLMDEHKRLLPDYLDNYDRNDPIQPIFIESTGFASKGGLKGLNIPSPFIKLESIFLLPGRQGSPVVSRARISIFKYLIAL